jgi:hypothetical protein
MELILFALVVLLVSAAIYVFLIQTPDYPKKYQQLKSQALEPSSCPSMEDRRTKMVESLRDQPELMLLYLSDREFFPPITE